MGTQYAGANTFPASFTIPDTGDPEAAVSVNVALEALADRTVFLKSRLHYELVTMGAFTATHATIDHTDGVVLIDLVTLPTVVAGDVVEVEFAGPLSIQSPGSTEALADFLLYYSENGAPIGTFAGSPTRLGTDTVRIPQFDCVLAMKSARTVSVGGTFLIGLRVYELTTAGNKVGFILPFSVKYKVWRVVP